MRLQNNLPIVPFGSVIGILGGGQLGQMIGLEARHQGYKIIVWDPTPFCPLSAISNRHETRPYDDSQALQEFIAESSVVITEFENIPFSIITEIAKHRLILPHADALKTAQQRHKEKDFFRKNNIATTNYYYIDSNQNIDKALNHVRLPAILKTNSLGYDGKGQFEITNPEDYKEHAKEDHILEEKLDFSYEFSLLIARDQMGNIAIYPPSINHHQGGIIRHAVPMAFPFSDQIHQMIEKSTALVANWDYIGLLCIEFFVMKDGTVLANEMAPRPHNSFHWTQQACPTSQFSQILRIATGQSLGATDPWHRTEMINLIGDDILDLDKYYHNPLATVHLYGKEQSKPGRKMGHVNIIHPAL